MPLSEDTMLENRYRIDRLLATGGMGSIYRAYDTNLKMTVAIKENFFQTPEGSQQFEQEALILARLRHPGLPRVIHHFSFEGRQYLVMDYIEGKDLWEIVKEQGHPLEEKKALAYIIEVCDAIHYLHRQKPTIIHRDIKPQNIKITPDDKAVLVDFGIAKVGDQDIRTRTGARGVTPGFSPPEQYSGMGTTIRSDVYSLGATLYAVLTAKKPPDSISLLVGGAKFEPPNVINPNLSLEVTQAIEYAMQVQQPDRPETAESWKQELQAVLTKLNRATDQATAVSLRGADNEQTLAGAVPAATTKFWLVDKSGLGYAVGQYPMVIGRHAKADVPIKVLSASREHALIKAEGDRCFARDNNSANGTFINDQSIGPEWQPLNPGDELAVGTTRFTLSTTQPANVAPPRPKSNLVDPEQEKIDTHPEAQKSAAVTPPAPSISEQPTPPPMSPAQRPTAVSPAPRSAAAAQPATQNKLTSVILPIALAVIILGGAAGVAAYFIFNSGSAAEETEPAVAQVEATEEEPPQAGKTATAQANAQSTSQAEMTAQAQDDATSTAQAQDAANDETATAQAVAAQTETSETEPTQTPTPTQAPATDTPTPAASPTQTQTESPATPTATPTQAPPTPTPRPVVSGPTVIPLDSEESIDVIGEREVIDVDINPENPKEVYTLVKGDGIYKSSNGGDGPWARMTLDGSGLTAFVIDPTNPARFFAPSWNAVLRSDDGGNTWKAYGNGLSTANRVVDVVTVDPVTPNVLYAGIGSALVVSTDGGENWTSEGFGNGLGQQGRLTVIVVDPFNHDVVFVGGQFGSVYKSVDSGRNFQQLAFNTGRGTYGMAAHPTQKDVYLVGINSFDAAIMKTTNGADFQSSSAGLVFGGADSAYSAIVYAPSNPNIVYTGSGYEDDGNAKGIFKSTDGGKSWTGISNGLSVNPTTGFPHYVKSMAVHPTNADIVFAASGGGLYKSVDGGATWVLK